MKKDSVSKNFYTKILTDDLAIAFSVKNISKIPRLHKICLHNTSSATLKKREELFSPWVASLILGGTRAGLLFSKKSVSGFKLKEKSLLGCSVNLRRYFLYRFLDLLMVETLPRELSTRSDNWGLPMTWEYFSSLGELFLPCLLIENLSVTSATSKDVVHSLHPEHPLHPLHPLHPSDVQDVQDVQDVLTSRTSPKDVLHLKGVPDVMDVLTSRTSITSLRNVTKDVLHLKGVPDVMDVVHPVHLKGVKGVIHLLHPAHSKNVMDVQDVIGVKDVQDVIGVKDVQNVLTSLTSITKDVLHLKGVPDVMDVQNVQDGKNKFNYAQLKSTPNDANNIRYAFYSHTLDVDLKCFKIGESHFASSLCRDTSRETGVEIRRKIISKEFNVGIRERFSFRDLESFFHLFEPLKGFDINFLFSNSLQIFLSKSVSRRHFYYSNNRN
jgi:hypothetical protein